MYEIYTPESAPQGSKAALEAIRERVGFLPNLAATMGGSPVLAGSFDALQGLLRDTTLTGPEREVVGLTVSYANSCAPSMAIHSTFALKLGLAPEVVTALRAGMPLPDERLHALHELTLSLVHRRGYLDQAKLQAFEAAGYTTEQLFEVIAQVAYTSIANWVANITDPPLVARSPVRTPRKLDILTGEFCQCLPSQKRVAGPRLTG